MGLFTDGFKLLKKASEPLYKTPKSIQETIEIMAVAENGIFEVSRNKYSKCYRFQDINYTTATEDEQIGIFERYCKFLNSLDCNYKITINNKNKNMEDLRDKVLITEKNDGFNNYRRIYNDIIEEKIIEGRQGIEQERYLTITIERKNFEEAKAQFATLEATIHKAFIELGAEIVPLNGNERLKVLYDYYHLGDEGSFDFDIKKAKKLLQHILQEDPGTKSDKDMLVFVDELADSAVVMGLRVWVPTDKFWKIKWRLNEKIKESFDANGISIPYPQMDVHMR